MLRKTTLYLALLLMPPAWSNVGYQLIHSNTAHEYHSYAKIDHTEGSLWASLNSTRKFDDLSSEILLQGMNCFDKEAPQKIIAPDFYSSISSITIAHAQPLVLTVTDYLGQWYLMKIDAKHAKINRTLQIKEFSVVRTGATSPKGYFLGGSDKNRRPLLMFYSTSLDRQKILNKKDSKEGEISSVFSRGDEVFAIYNKRSEAHSSTQFISELHLYSSVGLPATNIKLDGLDGTGIALEDRSVIVSYWEHGKIYMERFDSALSPQWKTPLHQIEGIASTKGSLLQVGQSLAWVGANDNKLLIHRVGRDGSIHSTRAESIHGLNAPQPLTYAASSYGEEIHVRGITNRGQGATLSAVTEFCLVEKP